MKQKHRRKLSLYGFVIIVILLCIVRIVSLNIKYPVPERNNIVMGQAAETFESDIWMTVKNATSYDEQWLLREHPDWSETVGDVKDLEGIHLIAVDLEIHNKSNYTKTFELYNVRLETLGFFQTIPLELHVIAAPDIPLEFELNSGEIRRVHAYYEIYQFQGDWDEMCLDGWSLVCRNYPIKNYWNLDL